MVAGTTGPGNIGRLNDLRGVSVVLLVLIGRSHDTLPTASVLRAVRSLAVRTSRSFSRA